MWRVTVLLSLDLLTDRRGLGVVDETKTLVALSNPFPKKGKQQTVTFGRTGIEGANMRSRTDLFDIRDTHAHRQGNPQSSRGISTLRGSEKSLQARAALSGPMVLDAEISDLDLRLTAGAAK
jgi:hypothetical protein